MFPVSEFLRTYTPKVSSVIIAALPLLLACCSSTSRLDHNKAAAATKLVPATEPMLEATDSKSTKLAIFAEAILEVEENGALDRSRASQFSVNLANGEDGLRKEDIKLLEAVLVDPSSSRVRSRVFKSLEQEIRTALVKGSQLEVSSAAIVAGYKATESPRLEEYLVIALRKPLQSNPDQIELEKKEELGDPAVIDFLSKSDPTAKRFSTVPYEFWSERRRWFSTKESIVRSLASIAAESESAADAIAELGETPNRGLKNAVSDALKKMKRSPSADVVYKALSSRAASCPSE